MNGWFDVNRSKADEFFFVLKAGNGEVVMTSEMYKSRASADTGIASVQKNSADDFNYERATAADGRLHFNLRAANHQVIGSSQMYATRETREVGIESVKENGMSTTIKDNTKA
ncbi:MAG: YegP family protein [Usitatibacter sp.]